MLTQEFHLSITPLGNDRYLIRTEAVADGVPLAEIQVDWPVQGWLSQAQRWHEDPLANLLATGETGQGTAHQAEERVALGRALYDALFHGRVRDSWLKAQGVAQNRHQLLRLRLGFKDSRLQRLPWELLYEDDCPLATGVDITFSRFYADWAAGKLKVQLPPPGQPVRVLVVVSAPDDQERLELRREVKSLQQELRSSTLPMGEAIGLELTILEQPGRAELVQALEQGQFQMLHYAGHSEVSKTGGDLFLVSAQTGFTERLSGEDLAGLLVNNGISLAVFNSCRGAYTAADDQEASWREQNLVQALVKRGVPAVIAMAERIPDAVAITFTQLLYRSLRLGYPVDLCLSRARQGLKTSSNSEQAYWMLPILYLNPEFDGYLYRREPGDEFGAIDANLPLEVMPWAAGDREMQAEDEELRQLLAQRAPESADLIDQLSQPVPPEEPLPAAAEENLLVDWETKQPPLNQALADPVKSPLPEAELSSSPFPQPWRQLPRGVLLGGALGLVGALAAVALAVVFQPDPAPPVAERPSPEVGSGANPDSPLFAEGLAALKRDELDTAAAVIEQLLDRSDVATAGSLLAQASQEQLTDPDLAYALGRRQWQASLQGIEGATARDAWRSWQIAVKGREDFLAAQIAFGFASYRLGQYDDAIATWKQAIALDARQVRDQAAVADPDTAQAYLGLAMAYWQLSQQPDGESLRLQAEEAFDQVLAVDPALINPNPIHWLLQPVAADIDAAADDLGATL